MTGILTAPDDRDFLVRTKSGFTSMAYKMAGQIVYLSVNPQDEAVSWADVPKELDS